MTAAQLTGVLLFIDLRVASPLFDVGWDLSYSIVHENPAPGRRALPKIAMQPDVDKKGPGRATSACGECQRRKYVLSPTYRPFSMFRPFVFSSVPLQPGF